MKAFIFLLSLSFLTITISSWKKVELANPAIDTAASEVIWTGYHLAKSYEHTGKVNLKSGNLTIENGKLTGGTLTIDMTSISNTDLTKEKDNKKLVNHLKSKDFFAIESYPEARLTLTSVTSKGANKYSANGDITIRDITKPITFDVTQKGASEFIADVTINRTDFEVMYGWKLENAMLSSDFNLKVKLVTKE